MQSLDVIDLLRAACKGNQKWGLYINIFVPDTVSLDDRFNEILKAATILDIDKHGQIMSDENGWFLFDTEEEMNDAYWRCVGDDGPCDLNTYDGPVRIYAITCNPDGISLNENT